MLKHLDEYRDTGLASKILKRILGNLPDRSVNLMEVCGTHTMSISRFGLRKALSPSINLISGPGCPVCVTPVSYLDKAIAYSKRSDMIVATFGDMFRVPGSASTLEREKSQGSDARIVYSPTDCLKIAGDNPEKTVLFLAVGFETTTPTIAGMLKIAEREKVDNLTILCGNKLIPPAMKAIMEDREVKIDGFILPAHVSTMIGFEPYRFITERYSIPAVITGFESLDILAGIEMILEQIRSGKASVENEYGRFAKRDGNPKANILVDEIFKVTDAKWRGFGSIPASGLALREGYEKFDVEKRFPIEVKEAAEPKGCLCGNVVKGLSKPTDCPLFAKRCTPENPVGACMVSSEGTCAAYYKYERM